jgi:hypothetical protein
MKIGIDDDRRPLGLRLERRMKRRRVELATLGYSPELRRKPADDRGRVGPIRAPPTEAARRGYALISNESLRDVGGYDELRARGHNELGRRSTAWAGRNARHRPVVMTSEIARLQVFGVLRTAIDTPAKERIRAGWLDQHLNRNRYATRVSESDAVVADERLSVVADDSDLFHGCLLYDV